MKKRYKNDTLHKKKERKNYITKDIARQVCNLFSKPVEQVAYVHQIFKEKVFRKIEWWSKGRVNASERLFLGNLLHMYTTKVLYKKGLEVHWAST